jgi:hypothetical protein
MLSYGGGVTSHWRGGCHDLCRRRLACAQPMPSASLPLDHALSASIVQRGDRSIGQSVGHTPYGPPELPTFERDPSTSFTVGSPASRSAELLTKPKSHKRAFELNTFR